ncbi:putative bolA-like protein C8C9.11 [Erysiphe neolycopersici]|uniref:Putative bolA-like protein C8C9.11 n=1 Tax=Erysiphe neolycopersici TaxID=212602 RepID=A0A420HQD3_9PEZI|nr:putative bolA-like protein C8C9.11 [Erysiphe neolycopersici]
MTEKGAISITALTEKIKKELEATHTEIQDISGGCGQSFSCIIVSPLFENKSTLARHRLVNTTLKDEIAIIHAWTVNCYTPDKWNEQLQSKKESN